jgi:hypothetical protein
MEWATTIFPFENRFEPSDFVERIWRTPAAPDKAMISVAVPHWHIVFVKGSHSRTRAIVRGPETKASIVCDTSGCRVPRHRIQARDVYAGPGG